MEKAQYPVNVLCRILEVSRSGYYAWQDRPASARTVANRRLTTMIRATHQQHRQRYGCPHIVTELRTQGEVVGRHRVARLMRAEGLQPLRRRRFRVTTKADPRLPVAENVLDRQFTVSRADTAWVGDITYVWTAEGWLYVAVLLDLYSRRVVGLGMGQWIDTALVLRALAQALGQRQPAAGLIHHTDRGSQYAAHDYQRALKDSGLIPSMSRKGNCWDTQSIMALSFTPGLTRVGIGLLPLR